MRIGVFHAVGPGGALRFIIDTTERLAVDHDVRVFQVLLGGDPLPTWSQRVSVATWSVAPSRMPRGVRPLDLARRWAQAQVEVADAMNEDRAAAVIVHPCRLTQAPEVLLHLRQDAVYFMQEVRRRTFEPGYIEEPTGPKPIALMWRAALRLSERRPRMIDRRAVAAASMLLANSAFTASAIKTAYGRHASVVHPGIDERTFTAEEVERKSHVLVVGGLERNKGALDVIAGLAAVPEAGRPSLIVTGQRRSVAFAHEIETHAQAAGVAVRIVHDVGDAELVSLYRTALATAAFATKEPFGLTPVESLACGTPVIAVNEGGYVETVQHGVNGALVPRDPLSFADGLEVLRSMSATRDELRASVLPEFGLDAATRRLLERVHVATGRAS